MRWIVYGVGAVGGVIAAALSRSGQEVLGIARGAQLEAIRAGGLRLRSPKLDFTVEFDCVAGPEEITFGPDDAILLAMKTQDCLPVLERLRTCGVSEQPIFCLQNGVANERMALRRFPNVHGVTVMCPASYLTAGEVLVHCEPTLGLFDIGRYPSGSDAADHAFAAALDGAGMAGFVSDTVMESKYGKLLMNTANILDAALGRGTDPGPWRDRLRSEAEAVLRAAGIAWSDVGASDPRRQELLKVTEIPDAPRIGGSTSQSLRRGTGSIETDYLNGEIALIARLAGIEAPLNARMPALAQSLVERGAGPGSMTVEDLERYLG